MKLISILALIAGMGPAWLQAAAPSSQPNRPGAIVEKHLAAAGGREALAAVHSQTAQFDVQEGGATFTAEVRCKEPYKLLLIFHTPDGLVVRQGCDRQGRCWRQDPNSLREFTSPRDLVEFRELWLCLNVTALLRLEKAFPELRSAGQEKLGDVNCDVIDAKSDIGQVKLWFDSKTGLLAGVGGARLEEYRSENGIQVPHLIHKDNGATTLKLKSISFNRPLEDKQFELPGGATAVAANESGSPQYVTLLNRGTQLGIVRRPQAADFARPAPKSLPTYRGENPNGFQVDVRSMDVSGLNVAERLADLLHADFDTKTVWPATLPVDFVPKRIAELGKNPGLGVQELHKRGITGKGIGLAIIDQPLLVDHVEYKDRVRTYEELHSLAGASAQMHGPAVASIAVGKTVGVAPEADLYYVAETHGTFGQGKFDWDFTWLAQSIDRILAVNATLPAAARVRVISISVGWTPGQKGCEETDRAVRRATDSGVFVISTALEHTHNLAFHGLGRDSRQDPEKAESFGLGSWWANSFIKGQRRFGPGERLLVPMDSRTTASPTGAEDYVFYAAGGWSWCVPYLAGLYALACQVHPAVRPAEFWATALKTGHVIKVQQEGATYDLGNIVDAVALIEALQGRAQSPAGQ